MNASAVLVERPVRLAEAVGVSGVRIDHSHAGRAKFDEALAKGQANRIRIPLIAAKDTVRQIV